MIFLYDSHNGEHNLATQATCAQHYICLIIAAPTTTCEILIARASHQHSHEFLVLHRVANPEQQAQNHHKRLYRRHKTQLRADNSLFVLLDAFSV